MHNNQIMITMILKKKDYQIIIISLSNNEFLDLAKIKAFADDKI